MSHTTDSDAATIELTHDIIVSVNGAAAAGKPLVVAYVDESGRPHVSIRGTIQVVGPDRLALWSRSPGLPQSLAARPHLDLLYQNLAERAFYRFSGRGFVEQSEELRSQVFDGSPERERAQDPDRRGAAVIIELDSVEGVGPSGPIRLTRADAI